MECAKDSATLAIFTTSPVECRDEYDERYERCYKLVRGLTDGVSEKDAHDALNTNNARGAQAHEDAAVGLLVSILSSSDSASTKFRDLTLTSRDGMAAVISQLQFLVVEKYGRLQDAARQQLLWLLRQLIRNSVNGTDGVCWNLMRQIVGGDISPKNVWLAESLLDIFIENRSWLEKHQFLTASVVYCYLRIIEDHFPPQFQQLREKEAGFIVQLLRERFADCIIIGRDLVRLLQHVARVPRIDALWRDLLHNPTVLMPNFTGLLQLLQSRTSRRFLPCRLTPDMEKKIVFLTSHVRFGSQKRYQEWFQKQYLSTPESQSLRCDLIRFIVGVIHPTNELLSSDIIPRWAVIGWLLTTCTSQVALANAKLALFFDWLFYDAEKDNIMNIEPAVLVMHHSLRPHPAITATLLDFMCRIIPTFYPPLTERVTQGMYTALRQIVKMRVLPSLEPLFINAKLDKELRRLLKERFAEFCASNDGSSSGAAAGVKAEDSDGTGVTASGDTVMTPPVTGDPSPLSAVCGEQDQSADEPAFSDDEDCCEIKPAPAAPVETQPRPATPVNTTTAANLGVCVKQDLHVSEEDVFGEKYSDAWDELVAPLRKQLDKLRHETDSEMRCEAVESICRTVCDGEFSEDTLASLAFCLVANFHSTLTQSVFPPEDQVTPDRLDESVRQPLFVLLRGLCDCSDGHPCRSLLIALVTALCQHSDRVAHLLLYYIVVRTQNDDKDVRDDMFGVYKDVCTARRSDRSLSDQLVEDIQVCVDVEPAMLVWLVPALYSHLPSVCVGNAELLHLVLCRLDGRQLLQLVSHAVRGQLVIFRRDSFIKVIDASLEWETFEQYCLWQLVEAHELTVDYIVPLITRLDCQRHWEAVTALLLMLKREEPCMELMKPLMLRSYDSDNAVGRDQDSSVPQTESNDLLVSSVLLYWVCEYQQQTAELIANLVNRSSLTPNKRKRTTAPRSSPHLPSTELLLQHLDRLRQSLRVAASSSASSANSFWSIDEVQTALSVAQSGCVEVQRQRFAELFALVDVDDDSASRTRRARKAAARGRASAATTTAAGGGGGRGQSSQHRIASAVSSVVDDSSDSEQSTEDEQVKKPSRKRRKNNQLNSDSD